MMGRVVRYIRLDPDKCIGDDDGLGWSVFDEALAEANEMYRRRMHNIFCDNCHSHVATALQIARYQSLSHWNMVMLALWVFVAGRYVSVTGFLYHWVPFLLIAFGYFLIST